jgi:hypothetical protein
MAMQRRQLKTADAVALFGSKAGVPGYPQCVLSTHRPGGLI